MSGKFEKPKQRYINWIIIIILLLIITAIMFLLVLFDLELVIDTSNMPLVVEYGEEMPMPTAKVRGDILFKSGFHVDVIAQHIDDMTSLGQHTNTYIASYNGYESTVHYTYLVVDTKKPIITLYNKDSYRTLVGEKYVEEGFSANDNYDGDITKKVLVFESDDKVTYMVQDSAGNLTMVERHIEYHDIEAPIIKLNGDDVIKLYVGQQYVEQGATATDNCDGDISQKIQISGEVNVAKVGTYCIEYFAIDSSGNEARSTRKVQVERRPVTGKTIYLTFDDGPSKHTGRLLDVLDKYGVKATFFVVGDGDYTHMIKEIVNRGHAIGIHSVTHDYDKIYVSEEAYFNDLYAMQKIILDNTGVETKLIRFPGGSSNTVSRKYSQGIMTKLAKSVEEKGFVYFDWNVTSHDANGKTKTADVVFESVIDGVSKLKESVVLQHDTKEFSVDAVENIILWALENGYTFDVLSENGPLVHHGIAN